MIEKTRNLVDTAGAAVLAAPGAVTSRTQLQAARAAGLSVTARRYEMSKPILPGRRFCTCPKSPIPRLVPTSL
jgi:hypothetical protein